MKNNISLIFTTKMNSNELLAYVEMVKKIIKDNSITQKVYICNDSDFNLKLDEETSIEIINNGKNIGKFMSVLNISKKIDGHFVIFDPDDVQIGTINWKKFKSFLGEFYSDTTVGNRTIINSYIEYYKGKVKSKNSKKIYFYTNPSIIYCANNLNEFQGPLPEIPITYFDDALLLVLSNRRGISFYDCPYYGYNKKNGVTSDWKKYSPEIVEANNIMKNLDTRNQTKKIKLFRVLRLKYMAYKAKKIVA